MSAYVLARKTDAGELYWCGRDARMRWSPFISDSFHFSSARCAYEAAAAAGLDIDAVRAIRRDRTRRRAA